jgi:hypothetical protein
MRRISLALAVLILPLCTFTATGVESPQWWKQTRSIYASFDLSGAGGPLMKFPSDDIHKKLGTFRNLPVLLDEARRLGCNCVYLVSWWEPDYAGNKGDYEIRGDLGGPEAFKEGIAGIHQMGGRIILYLEPFIITRTSDVGRSHGPEWCMKDTGGRAQSYYGNRKYFLMWPGEGSGWSDYICGVAEELVRRYGVDGFHLDSYGCQWDLKDADPRHTGSFNEGAVDLVRNMRRRIRRIKGDAIIMLECCERTELLDVCDGGQIESGAWQHSPVKVLNEKPWVSQCKYKAFTSHYSMEEMDKILRMGYNLSLSPWWFENHTGEKDFERMSRHIDERNEWIRRMRILWNWDNLLYINGAPRPRGIDLFQLRRELEMVQYSKPKPKYYETESYWAAVDVYERSMKELLSSGKVLKSQGQYLKERLSPQTGPR